MRTHELKTHPDYFQAIKEGKKRFEVRKNDRDFKVGDSLWLREWNPDTKEYTDRNLYVDVTYILKDFETALIDGYVIMSIDVFGELPF